MLKNTQEEDEEILNENKETYITKENNWKKEDPHDSRSCNSIYRRKGKNKRVIATTLHNQHFNPRPL